MDNELKNEWGDQFEKVEPGITALGAVQAPVNLKHRILNREFEYACSTRRMTLRYVGIAACTAACGALVLVNSGNSDLMKVFETAPTKIAQNAVTNSDVSEQPSSVSDEDVSLLSDALDGDSVASQLAFDLVPNTDGSAQEELL